METDFIGIMLVVVVSFGIWFVLRSIDVVEHELPPRYRRRARALVNSLRPSRRR